MHVQLIVVDPQNDFCDPKGALSVPGADKDMDRLAAMIRRVGSKLDDIHVTLDSHQMVGIERPLWWKRVGDGAKPDPFTVLGVHPDGKRIVKLDPTNNMAPTEEEYTTHMPSHRQRSFDYLVALTAGGRYPHVVWPVHCVIPTWGWSVYPALSDALCEWEAREFGRISYITKGNNPWTEHFSGVKAEVPDPEDSSTQINADLITALEEADIIAIAGEALSHCVAATLEDIVTSFNDPRYVEKMVVLTDCTSSVPGFEAQGDARLKVLQAKGLQVSTSVDFLA